MLYAIYKFSPLAGGVLIGFFGAQLLHEYAHAITHFLFTGESVVMHLELNPFSGVRPSVEAPLAISHIQALLGKAAPLLIVYIPGAALLLWGKPRNLFCIGFLFSVVVEGIIYTVADSFFSYGGDFDKMTSLLGISTLTSLIPGVLFLLACSIALWRMLNRMGVVKWMLRI